MLLALPGSWGRTVASRRLTEPSRPRPSPYFHKFRNRVFMIDKEGDTDKMWDCMGKWQNVNVHIISIAPMINSFGDKEHCFVVLPVLQNLKKTTTGITIKTMQVALGHTIGKKILAEQNAWPLANAAMDTVFHAQFTHVCFSLHVLFQTKTLVKNRCCV